MEPKSKISTIPQQLLEPFKNFLINQNTIINFKPSESPVCKISKNFKKNTLTDCKTSTNGKNSKSQPKSRKFSKDNNLWSLIPKTFLEESAYLTPFKTLSPLSKNFNKKSVKKDTVFMS
jgi:hypothetical protein